ncbi:MAG: hypothetical protein JKP97_21740 [Rhodobacteraceae bacterium]|jgi:septation ring formation regulator EzrA|nr:hypothetical protein [Paracoccaceae bacterium]
MAAPPRGTVTNELLFETLKAMHGTLARHSEDLREIKERLGIMEMQYACLSRRLDRIEKRIDRIDTGLGLVES